MIDPTLTKRIEALLNEVEENAIDADSAATAFLCIRWRSALRNGTFTARAPALVADLVQACRDDAVSDCLENVTWALNRAAEATAILADLNAPAPPSTGEASR